MAAITLPNRFTPRPYQDAVMAYFDRGGLRACNVWHRRAGKDTCAIHQIAKMAHQRRGLYWHLLPTQRQARKVVWDAFTRGGERLIDQALPRELRKGDPNNTEMKMPLKCGSLYQLVGADAYDSLVGANPIGVVFSEWSLTDPRIWDYIRPILMENGGWAWFIFTPRGYNHGHDIKEIASNNKDWFYSKMTVRDTGILTEEDIRKEMKDGMPEELVEQEFYCSFSSANVGAIMGKYVEAAEHEGRIVEEELYDPDGGEVEVSGDLGFRDAAAFWFWQTTPSGLNLIDYMEETGLDAPDWIDRLKVTPYGNLGNLYLPHDARAKTFAVKHSVMEQFIKAGFRVRLVPRSNIADRINAGRTVFPHCRFNRVKCARGLMALRDWQYSWDDVRKTFSQDPVRNWATHGGDGYTYGAMMMADTVKEWKAKQPKPPKPVQEHSNEAYGASYVFNLEDLWALHEEQSGGRILTL